MAAVRARATLETIVPCRITTSSRRVCIGRRLRRCGSQTCFFGHAAADATNAVRALWFFSGITRATPTATDSSGVSWYITYIYMCSADPVGHLTTFFSFLKNTFFFFRHFSRVVIYINTARAYFIHVRIHSRPPIRAPRNTDARTCIRENGFDLDVRLSRLLTEKRLFFRLFCFWTL